MTEMSARIGIRLSAYRAERKATQEYVASQMRAAHFPWTRETVARVESGDRALTIDEFCVLAHVIGFHPSELWPEAS